MKLATTFIVAGIALITGCNANTEDGPRHGQSSSGLSAATRTCRAISGRSFDGKVVKCPEGSTPLPAAQQWCERSTYSGDLEGSMLFVTTVAYEPDLSVYGGIDYLTNGADSATFGEKGAWDPASGDTASLMWFTGGTGKWAGKTGIIHFSGVSTGSSNPNRGEYTYSGQVCDQ